MMFPSERRNSVIAVCRDSCIGEPPLPSVIGRECRTPLSGRFGKAAIRDGSSQIVFEREGTGLQLWSELEVETLLELAASLQPVQNPPGSP